MTAHEVTKPVHEPVILSPTCQRLAGKRAMLKKLLCRKHRDETTIHAMSKGQEALWYVYQNAPDSAAYNVAMAFQVHASLDEDRMETALKLLVQRHEVLRTDYAVFDDRNVQRVHPQVGFSLHRVDAAGLDEHELHARIVSDYSRPFDLSTAPPLRAYHYRVTGQRGVLLLVVHHIAIDAASLWILMEELAEIYQALQRGEKRIRCQKSASYLAFCRQQEEWVASGQGRAARDYWKQTLAADAPPLTLDISRPRPAVQDHKGATRYFAIPSALAEDIKALAKREGVTHFATLLAAWTCLLSRHSGQEDICVVSPTSGRSHSEFARSIGYFVNPVVIRTKLADNPTVIDFLQRVQQGVWETLEHQQFPFASVIEAVNPRRDSAISPYSQVSFVFQKAQGGAEMVSGWRPGQEGPRVAWAGMEVQQYPLDQQEGQFELELEVTETGGRFYGIVKYCTALFDPKDIDALAARYIELLRSMVAQPDVPLGSLNILTAAEHAQLAQWNATDFVYPPHRNLHELIAAQVRRTPDAVALKFGDEGMTYAYMNRQANRLAHYLVSQGVQPGTRVGVCMTRSFEMVLSLLAVIKAGAAYVPVDPTYPAERVAFLLRDMEAPLILSQAHLADKMPEVETRFVSVDRLVLDTYPDEDPSCDVGPDDLAYIIYTSGSTGNPKGAMNTHAAICNRLLWMQKAYSLDESDSVLQKTPFSFDVSVWEFFWPLLTGARLVIARPDGHKDVDYLIDTICREGITTLHFVPSMLSVFVANPDVSYCTSIRRVICSGEALSHDLQQRFFQRLDTELHNLYGPTEAAIDVTAWQCLPSAEGSVVPIGKPIDNIQIHIVDRHLQPVPVGVNGELLIGGVGLARGYFKRDELTASRFIADRFSKHPNACLYRTGDLVRYLPDGNIEYLQRMDDQVKLRGFRIELGEVEAMLNRCDGVRESVVVKRSRAGGDFLLAFATRDGHAQDEDAILHQLEAWLPSHCIPSALVFLDTIPLTPNGKVDRNALPEYVFDGARDGTVIAPRNTIERKLQRLWQDLLQVERLSVNDNFFDLGGHSLLAVRLMASIEIEFGQRLPLASLVQYPTVAGLATQLEGIQQDWGSLVPIQEKGEGRPLFLVPGGGGNVLYFYPLAEQLGSARPCYGLQARGLDGVTPPLHDLAQIAREMVGEIKQVQPAGPYLIAGHCVGGLVAFAIAQELLAAGDQIERLLVIDAPAPHFFDATEHADLSQVQWIAILVGTIAHMTGQPLSIDAQALESATTEERLIRLRACLAEAGVVPANTPLAPIGGLLQVFIANSQLSYNDKGNIHPMPINLYRARDIDPHYDYRRHDDAGMDMSNSTLGWGRYASGEVGVHLVDGDHITMLAAANANGLATAISNSLR